ncbi:hypothetical protein [Mucilaginibacter frigoritolerans]|nr:hypothetical protein [Mucilaginibacter frigoritolerans]
MASFYFRIKMIRLKSPWLVFLFVILYFYATYLYFDILNETHQTLRDHHIYIDFGHASLLLVIAFLICMITGVITTISIITARANKKISN